MKKSFKVKSIPTYLKAYAADITEARLEATKDQYTTAFNKRTGIKESLLLGDVERSYYTEYVGILGELLVRKHYDLDPSYSGYKVSSFVKNSDNIKNDMDLTAFKDGQPIKVSIKAGEGSYKVSKHSADKDESDIVVFIIFMSPDKYAVHVQTVEHIREKFIVKHGHSPYYFRQLQEGLRKLIKEIHK